MALVTGLIISMGFLGGVMVQAPLTLLINHIGWRESVLIVAIIGYLVALMIFLMVRETPKGTESIVQNRKEQLQQIGVFKSLRISLLRGQNWLAGSYTSLINLPIFMLGALWGIPYLTQVHGQTLTGAATISGMLYFGSMFGMPVMGAISDKMHRRRLPMQIGAVLSIINILVIMISPSNNFWFLALSFFFLGFITSVQVISYPLVVEINPKMISSSCTCVISMLCMGGGALIQPLFGYLLSSHGAPVDVHNVMAYPASSYLFAMKALPIAFIIALILTFFIKETYCEHHD
jgi:MFS family permease